MAATQSIDTPELSRDIVSLPLAANTTIYAGTLAAVDSDGRAVPAADAAGLRVIGRAEEEKSCGETAGAESIQVKRGIFRFTNSGSDAVDANDIGKDAYVEDDATVCETGGSHKVKAGRVVQVEDKGVWIDTAHASRVPSADTLTALTFSSTVTSTEAEAFRDAVLALLQAQGLVK